MKNNKKTSQLGLVMHQLKKNRAAMIGLVIIIAEILLAIFAPVIMPYGYSDADYTALHQPPTAAHWFGTDDMGRDILSRLLYGARFSLSMGILSMLIATFFGIVIGSIAGYFGGQTDNIIMRILDIIQSIPMMVLTIAVAAVLGTGFVETIFALSVSCIPGTARLIRASMLNVRNLEYIEASQSINCSKLRIIISHMIPNSISPVIVSSTMGIGSIIIASAGLSFIGLGVQPPLPEWGAMLSSGRAWIQQYPHIVIFPGLAIMITVLALNMLGDGLRDALDPKLKN